MLLPYSSTFMLVSECNKMVDLCSFLQHFPGSSQKVPPHSSCSSFCSEFIDFHTKEIYIPLRSTAREDTSSPVFPLFFLLLLLLLLLDNNVHFRFHEQNNHRKTRAECHPRSSCSSCLLCGRLSRQHAGVCQGRIGVGSCMYCSTETDVWDHISL